MLKENVSYEHPLQNHNTKKQTADHTHTAKVMNRQGDWNVSTRQQTQKHCCCPVAKCEGAVLRTGVAGE